MAGGHGWQGKGAVCDRGACVSGGHTWGVWVACMAGGVHGGGRAWQEKSQLQRTVGILLECILVLI